MLHKQRSTLFSLAVFILLVGLVAGCGGSGGGESGSQEGAENGGGGDGGAAKKAEAPETKIALGEVTSVKSDRDKIVLRPPEKAQGDGPMVFKVRKNAQITLDDKKAELADVKKGQQAQIEYVVNKENNNRATAVKLFEGGGGSG